MVEAYINSITMVQTYINSISMVQAYKLISWAIQYLKLGRGPLNISFKYIVLLLDDY